MRIYKCDRCGKLLDPRDRFCGHIQDHVVDLCENCHAEYTKDKEAVENLYQKNMEAISVKYGMRSISEIIKKGEER